MIDGIHRRFKILDSRIRKHSRIRKLLSFQITCLIDTVTRSHPVRVFHTKTTKELLSEERGEAGSSGEWLRSLNQFDEIHRASDIAADRLL